MQTKLSVNLNKVALLRNQRDVGYPGVVEMARLVIEAGAHGITVHPRPDQRHIRPSDVRELSALIESEHRDAVEFNIEGYPSDDLVALVLEVEPTQVTLVPDAPEQRTSDHGWALDEQCGFLRPIVADFSAAGIRVSLFVDPEPGAMPLAKAAGADRVELYTEGYARAYASGTHAETLERYRATAAAAERAGLGVNAGHDLTLENLPAFKQRIPMLAEVSIGHAITADALRMGFPAAVRAYLSAIA